MDNAERLAQEIIRLKAKNVIIHSIPGTPNWLTCEKIGEGEWALTLFNPTRFTTYNLGTIDDKRHLELWRILTSMEIERRVSQAKLAQGFKTMVYNFKKAGNYYHYLTSFVCVKKDS